MIRRLIYWLFGKPNYLGELIRHKPDPRTRRDSFNPDPWIGRR